MEHLNRIEIRGRVGTVRKNEVNGSKVANFSLVSEYLYKTKDGISSSRIMRLSPSTSGSMMSWF